MPDAAGTAAILNAGETPALQIKNKSVHFGTSAFQFSVTNKLFEEVCSTSLMRKRVPSADGIYWLRKLVFPVSMIAVLNNICGAPASKTGSVFSSHRHQIAARSEIVQFVSIFSPEWHVSASR